jgi:general secretion pathway protein G
MKRSPRYNAAFTLLEIMMVVMIIALLAGAAIFAMKDQFSVAGDAKVKGDINSFKVGLMSYRSKNGFLPSTEQGLSALVKKPEGEPRPPRWSPFLTELPKDPWGMDYMYEFPARRGGDEYDIYSAGPNRKPGDADDIGNWKPADT